MRVLYPFRIWTYLGLAAALLAVPLIRYTDTTDVISLLSVGMFVLMLAAYGEIFASVRRSTRILRAMHGQRDLLVMAGFRLSDLKLGIWRNLWHSGGWTALGALLTARFALGLALAQYLYLFHIYLPQYPLIQPFNFALRGANYFSSFVSSTNYLQPEWWQRVTALLMLLIFLIAEMRLMMALGMVVTLRPQRMQRWALPFSISFRIVLAGFSLLVITGLSFVQINFHNGFYLRNDMVCMDPRLSAIINSEIAYSGFYYSGNRSNDANCPQIIFNAQAQRIIESTQTGMISLIDGGSLLSATVMRADLTIKYPGHALDYYAKVTYSLQESSYPPRYIASWNPVIGPVLPMLRMVTGAILPFFMLLIVTQVLNWLVARRYGTRSS